MRILLAAAAVALALAPAADAATPIERWAKTHNLKGKWRTKDADRDGVSSRREFALKTHPRRVDSDRDNLRDGDELKVGTNPRVWDTDKDGTRDGAENAGPITAYDGASITIERFHGGPITAGIAAYTQCLERQTSDEGEVVMQEEYVEVQEDAAAGDTHWAEEEAPLEDEAEVDLGGDDDYGAGACTDPTLEPGGLVTSAVIAEGVALDLDVKS